MWHKINRSKSKFFAWLMVACLGLVLFSGCSSLQQSRTTAPLPDLAAISLPDALVSGKPTIAEFGSDTCVGCRQMLPILQDIALEYDGMVNVLTVDVYDDAYDLVQQHRIMTIPTQIFFDADGQEVSRNVGTLSRERIVDRLSQMGVD